MSLVANMSRVAILIDGGYFMRRLPAVQPDTDPRNPDAACRAVARLIHAHFTRINKIVRFPHSRQLLYRAFYYDAKPYLDKGHLPISKRGIDYSKSDTARFQLAFHDNLRRTSNLAVRLGEVRRDPASLWELKPAVLKELLKGNRAFADLTDDDFRATFRQKAVDMRIGLDIASITLKQQADTIVLVAGDADFVPAAKLARREGLKIILDPLWRQVDGALFEHIDGVYSGFKNPKAKGPKSEEASQ
ncbi:NYN domain-containing protein [Frigidibacter sp. ROC022]|uniref:NYN domain-containing protein n=1 Tax=Frigidibacter sp. ROC022 TaxID=2971796 RepID=UPI00215B3114|nr:NYN domain-containing protein [Frigidibacter sp. ROC022]MCR8726470.1 NYN domain-containing protein [Frigidibacter sp. ROC022]